MSFIHWYYQIHILVVCVCTWTPEVDVRCLFYSLHCFGERLSSWSYITLLTHTHHLNLSVCLSLSHSHSLTHSLSDFFLKVQQPWTVIMRLAFWVAVQWYTLMSVFSALYICLMCLFALLRKTCLHSPI